MKTIFCLVLFTALFACGQKPTQPLVQVATDVPLDTFFNGAAPKPNPLRADTVTQARQVEQWYDSLTPAQRAAQLIMPATSEYYKIGIPYKEIAAAYRKGFIGGVLYLKGKKTTFSAQIKQLAVLGDSLQLPPLISACDCEPTLFHKKFRDADSVTATNLLTTENAIQKTVGDINRQLAEMGIHLNFAPIADLAANEAVISTRSFGKTAGQVEQGATAFVRASQSSGIAATLKHFPGHGAVVGDSHHEAVYINGEPTEAATFKSIIDAAQPAAVMVGHISIRHNPAYADSLPATLSRAVITGLLREEYGYKGLIVTDAMNMQAVRKYPGASFRALKAGADLVIMPLQIQSLHAQIVQAMGKEDKLAKQLEASVKRVLRLKLIYLPKGRTGTAAATQ